MAFLLIILLFGLAPDLLDPMSLRGVQKIPSLCSEKAEHSRKKRLRLPRRYAPRNDNLLYEIASFQSQRRITSPLRGSQ